MPSKKGALNNTPIADAPDSKQLDEPTGETGELYRSMVELSPDSIITTDAKGSITSCNTTITRMLGYSKDELIGKHFAKLRVLRLEDIPKYQKPFKNIVRGKVGEPTEVVLYRKDRTLVFADVRVSLLKVGGKTVIQATLRDITKRKQMEQEIQDKNEQLEAQNEELRATEEELRATNEELLSANNELREAQEQLIRSEKLAAIGQLASGVGHELRNPLGAIKNAVFYIQRRLGKTDLPTTEPRAIEFLDIINEEVDAANKVITDLLGFSRLAKPTVTPVSIAGIIEDALKRTHQPENIELTKHIDEGLPMVVVDADQIRQVFINLIINAQQAMEEGGQLDIWAKRGTDNVEVEFADTGCGIPESALNKIFDPLFTTKAKGIGLGLSVCKSMLEKHSGDIRVESKVMKGTTFTVSLPAVKTAREP